MPNGPQTGDEGSPLCFDEGGEELLAAEAAAKKRKRFATNSQDLLIGVAQGNSLDLRKALVAAENGVLHLCAIRNLLVHRIVAAIQTLDGTQCPEERALAQELKAVHRGLRGGQEVQVPFLFEEAAQRVSVPFQMNS